MQVPGSSSQQGSLIAWSNRQTEQVSEKRIKVLARARPETETYSGATAAELREEKSRERVGSLAFREAISRRNALLQVRRHVVSDKSLSLFLL